MSPRLHRQLNTDMHCPMGPEDVDGRGRGNGLTYMLGYPCGVHSYNVRDQIHLWHTHMQMGQDVVVEDIHARNQHDEGKQYLDGLACVDHSSGLPVVLQCKASITAGQAQPILLYHLPHLLVLILRVQQLQTNGRKVGCYSALKWCIPYRGDLDTGLDPMHFE